MNHASDQPVLQHLQAHQLGPLASASPPFCRGVKNISQRIRQHIVYLVGGFNPSEKYVMIILETRSYNTILQPVFGIILRQQPANGSTGYNPYNDHINQSWQSQYFDQS